MDPYFLITDSEELNVNQNYYHVKDLPFVIPYQKYIRQVYSYSAESVKQFDRYGQIGNYWYTCYSAENVIPGPLMEWTTETIQYLIDCGMDIHHWKLLSNIIDGERFDLFWYIVQISPPNSPFHLNNLNSVLVTGCQMGHTEFYQLLIQPGAKTNGICTYKGRTSTPLCIALDKNDSQLLQCLLDHNVSLNDPYVGRLLFHSMEKEDRELVERILELDFNLNDWDINFLRPFDLQNSKYLSIISRLIDRNIKTDYYFENNIITAAEQENKDYIEFLLQVTQKPIPNDTLFIKYLFYRTSLEMILWLINRGLDLTKANHLELSYAISRRPDAASILQLLSDQGITP